MPSRRSSPHPVEGVEVPIFGTDEIKWAEVTVPSFYPDTSSPYSRSSRPPRNAANCHIIHGDPTAYLIWKIRDDFTHALEVIDLFPCKEFHQTGLRLIFPEALEPFCFICKNEVQSAAGSSYIIYALTISGIAYLFNLKNLHSYASGSVISQTDFVSLRVQTQSQITAAVATSGCLVIGRHDGTVGCYRLGAIDQNAPGFMFELHNDSGIGRLWNLMSRGKNVGAVQDLVISEVFGRKLIFVAHSDGSLRAWELPGNNLIINRSLNLQETAGSMLHRLWIGDANYETGQILFAALYVSATETTSQVIAVYCLCFDTGEKITISSELPTKLISLHEAKLVDLKVTCNEVWILKQIGSTMCDLSCLDIKTQHTSNYILHEDFISDQLFEGSEHPFDDLAWCGLSTFSSTKDQVPYVMSTLFLRKLLQPGIYQTAALRATLMDQKQHTIDNEVPSFTVSSLKHELFATIESKGVGKNSRSVLSYWKKFCSQFFRHWCQTNTPYGLFVDSSSGAVGLIRKGSTSLFRHLRPLEVALNASFEECSKIMKFKMISSGKDLESEILFDILRCMSIISLHLGRPAASMVYESLVNPSNISYEDVITFLLKFLESGYCSQMDSPDGATWEKKQAVHKSHNKFAVEILLSFHALIAKATSWCRVLDVIELFLNNMIPENSVEHVEFKRFFNVNTSLLVQTTSQFAKAMCDYSFDMLMLLSYLVNVSAQVNMSQTDLSRIKLQIIPVIQNILFHWIIIYFVGTTPTEPVAMEEFSSRLSLLHIDSNIENKTRNGKLGTSGFTLAYLLKIPTSFEEKKFIISNSFPSPSDFVNSVWNYCGNISSIKASDKHSFSSHSTIEIACSLLEYGQYEASENLLLIVDAHLSRNKVSHSCHNAVHEWCVRLHLLGFCLVMRAKSALDRAVKVQKISEAVRCFFRVAFEDSASIAIQNISFKTSLPFPGNISSIFLWRYLYYQWAMQFFEQNNFSEAACEFALACLEQIDEVLDNNNGGSELLPEPASVLKGRLWANIFKFTLDLSCYRDSYCAIISNPDEDSKLVCLRRLIIVLYERGEHKILCNGELPFIGLVEKAEQELVWKAERSDISSRLNLYKLLYSFEIFHKNWRKAAHYMHRCSVQLREEIDQNQYPVLSSSLQEILCGLAASINALQLVEPLHGWIDSQHESYFSFEKSSPNKRARKACLDNSSSAHDSELHVDIDILEKEYVLTLAHYLLSLVNVKCTVAGHKTQIVKIVDSLVQENFYDVAFTLLLKFWKGSELKRELEHVFTAMSQKCCLNSGGSSVGVPNLLHNHLLTSSYDGGLINGKVDDCIATHQFVGNNPWEILEYYLEKYKEMHPRLPVTVVEALLRSNSQIELPLWLIYMFKGGRKATSWGMTGRESDPATLFRLYACCGRYAEATHLLLEYLEAFAALRPGDALGRKKMSAIWFPYVAIEQLWNHLEDVQSAGHMVDQCDKLKKLLRGMLENHLKQVKVDSDDALTISRVLNN